MRTFTYYKKTGEIIRNGEWDGDLGEDIEYDVDGWELTKATTQIIANEYFKKSVDLDDLRNLLCDLCDWEELYDLFEQELYDYFEDKALNG